MHSIKDISEDQFVLHFLQTELTSARFSRRIIEQLKADGRAIAVIEKPNLDSESENAYRRQLLGATRGYGDNRALFKNFPDQVSWKRVLLTKADLEKVLYIDWDYWVELSGGTRLVKDGAQAIKAGTATSDSDTSYDNFWQAAEAINSGTVFKDLIFVATNERAWLVVLEGHLRMTAYFLSDNVPDELTAIVGFSPNMANWGLY